MHGGELIDRYFSHHPDKKINEDFRKYGVAFAIENAIYKYEKQPNGAIKVYFKSIFEFSNQPIIENNKIVGHIRLAEPHTINTRKGTIIFSGVKKLKTGNSPVKKYRTHDVKIRKSFWPWSKKLIVKISNSHVNLFFICSTIHIETFAHESTYPQSDVAIEDSIAEETIETDKEDRPDFDVDVAIGDEKDKTIKETKDEDNIAPPTEPPKPEVETLPPIEKQENTETLNSLFTKYSSPLHYTQDEPWEYPVAKSPKKGCVIRSHQTGSTKRRGFKDLDFQKALESTFSCDFTVSGDIRLNIGENTRPFEPDIALIDKKSGLDIRIDIEVNEPYAGITRQAIHCIGDDDLRDNFFTTRGWVVIRFTEYQVHLQERECLAFVANYVKAINPNYLIPRELENIATPDKSEQWDLLQAQKWESKKWEDNGIQRRGWREEYLNHEFIPTPTPTGTPWRALTDQEKKEESLVEGINIGIPESLSKEHFNDRNKHPLDDRISFYPERHEYLIDKFPTHSVSTIVSRFFPVFDPPIAIANMMNGINWGPDHRYYGMSPQEIEDKWKADGLIAQQAGTHLHQQIEYFYLNKPYERPPEFELFENFVEQHCELEPYRTEWRIFDESKLAAGTIDLITKNEQGFDLYDWKRSKNVINRYDGTAVRENRFQQGVGQLNDIDDTSFNRYAIQQNIYRHILENNYSLKINKMYLVVIHPNYNEYYKVEVERLQDEVDYIFGTI